jgi:hypothetical protein
MTRPFFSKDRISDFDNFDRHAQDAISQMKSRLQAGFPIDIQVHTSSFSSHRLTRANHEIFNRTQHLGSH